MAQQHSPRQPPQALTAPERNGNTSLVTQLGFKTVSDHIDELGLFYLIGCAYHAGARSLRQIAKRFRVAGR